MYIAKSITARAAVHSYADAEEFLGRDRERIIASNVLVVRRHRDSIVIRLYDTDIIKYYSDGTFSWTNGGYDTPTTSARANQFGPVGVYFANRKGKLYANGVEEGARIPVSM